MEDEIASSNSNIVGKRHMFMTAYAILMTIAVVIYLYRTIGFFKFCLEIATSLHEQMFRGVTRAKMQFFHMNSSGRILNRFTKDMGCVDTSLPEVIADCANVSKHCHNDIYSHYELFEFHNVSSIDFSEHCCCPHNCWHC